MARQRTPEGPPPAPAVQKLRIRYSRTGRLRFSSTRDFARALERALRRAQVPMAFSAGFHPHPKISYMGAAPTGTASLAEYFEISVTREVDPTQVKQALNDALPTELDIQDVVIAQPGTSLADRLVVSTWQLEFPDLESSALNEAATALMSTERAEVTRVFKRGPKTFDVRGALVSVVVTDDICATMRMVVRHTTPAVRPDDVLTAMRDISSFAPPAPPRVTRLDQGEWEPHSQLVADPLAADRDAIGQ